MSGLRQTTLCFAPRARLPIAPAQGAEVVLARDAGQAIGQPPADPPAASAAPNAGRAKRRTLTQNAKMEIIKVFGDVVYVCWLHQTQFRRTHTVAETLKRYPELYDDAQLRKLMKNAKEVQKRVATGDGQRRRMRGFKKWVPLSFCLAPVANSIPQVQEVG